MGRGGGRREIRRGQKGSTANLGRVRKESDVINYTVKIPKLNVSLLVFNRVYVPETDIMYFIRRC
jgi:hypothetical protein